MKKTFFLLLIVLSLLLVGCTKSIAEVKQDKYIDEKVTVVGVVESTVKLGQLSGYTLADKNGDKIGVASDTLPEEGSKKTVTGTVKKLPLVGFYLEA